MAGQSSVNRDSQLAVMLLELKRHFNTCDTCRSAFKVADYGLICRWAQLHLITVARKWDANISGRLKARRSGEPYMFPCPDVTKHGQAYAMTAEAMMVVGVQETLI